MAKKLKKTEMKKLMEYLRNLENVDYSEEETHNTYTRWKTEERKEKIEFLSKTQILMISLNLFGDKIEIDIHLDYRQDRNGEFIRQYTSITLSHRGIGAQYQNNPMRIMEIISKCIDKKVSLSKLNNLETYQNKKILLEIMELESELQILEIELKKVDLEKYLILSENGSLTKEEKSELKLRIKPILQKKSNIKDLITEKKEELLEF